MRKLNISRRLLLLAPIAIWFSYFPSIHFGRGEGMNFELSITLIYCLILAVFGIFERWREIIKLRDSRAVRLVFVWILWQVISIFWAKNPVRAVLTAGVWGVLFLDFLVVLSFRKEKNLWKKIEKSLLLSSSVVSILAVIQVIYGAFIDWGLCRGCLAEGFGFVRPSVFAIEPQFLGSLLIAPILIAWYKVLRSKESKKNLVILFLDLVAMWLTLSRGAIFSLIPAMILAIFWTDKSSISIKKRFLWFFAIISLAFTSGILIHATMTALNPRVTDGFYDSVSKSVNQMSLGKVSLPKKQKIHNSVEKSVNKTVENTVEKSQKKAHFDGYVEKSTDERTSLSNFAIKTWIKNPIRMIFGVGTGSAGRVLHQEGAGTGWEFEIIQNEYLNILLENGLIGAIIWLVIIIGFFKITRYKKHFWAILVAFLLQWNFFSGLPNALHIYLILAVILSICWRVEFENSSKLC
ncbi:MAG: O-antigen ligase family protein [bacterium]|nr:O-antigen ligase family protein [bacterium]